MFNISSYHIGVIRHLLAIKNGNLDTLGTGSRIMHCRDLYFGMCACIYIYIHALYRCILHVYFMYMIEVGIMLE